jgi:acyl-CoA synthetase (AMP-forming)/AMP-acid ligase II
MSSESKSALCFGKQLSLEDLTITPPDADNVFHSPMPDVTIPEKTLTQFMLDCYQDDLKAVAMVEGETGVEWTHQQFRDSVRSFGSHLSQQGFKKGDILCMFAPNSPTWGVVFHGTASIGGVITPCNPRYRAEELEHQLKDAGATYIFTTQEALPLVKEATAEISTIKSIIVLRAADSSEDLPDDALLQDYAAYASDDGSKFPQVDIDPKNDLLMIPYSSGTTGVSKGVEITHFNVVANLCQFGQLMTGGPEHTLVAVLPFYHIYGLVVILCGSLCQGSKIVTLQRFDAGQFLTTLQKHKVTVAYIVPPIVLFLAKHPIIDKFDLSSLVEVFSGAAPLDANTADAVVKRLKLKNLRQGYGMTEMSPVSHITPAGSHKYGSAGVLVANLQAKIVDIDSKQAVGVNKEGEVWIRGPNIMRGYLNRPEATANTIDADGYIHTGDVGKIDENGALFIVDRVKELIKVSGFQVAPAEGEALLTSHEKIADAAVIPKPDLKHGEVPKAFVVLQPGAEMTAQEVMDFVAGHVATYKQIKEVEFVDVIPKSASGKILRRILRAAERQKATEAAAAAIDAPAAE